MIGTLAHGSLVESHLDRENQSNLYRCLSVWARPLRHESREEKNDVEKGMCIETHGYLSKDASVLTSDV